MAHVPANRVENSASLLRRCATPIGVAALWLLAPAAVQIAEACVCDASPPCFATWRADAVFVGTVVDEVSEPLGGSMSWRVRHVAVTQKLRGSVDASITLVPGEPPTAAEIAQATAVGAGGYGGSDCEYRPAVGGQYIIYAYRTKDGRWTTSRCSGTKPIERATEDLAYFAGLATAEPVGHLYGQVERHIVDPSDRTQSRRVPAAGVTVALTGKSHRLTVTTDAAGNIDAQVPPDEYTMTPVVPATVRVYNAPLVRLVAARGCGPVYFSLIANGRLEGRVVQRNGSPVSRVLVDVIPADLTPDKRPDATTAPSASTDENGRFRVDGILPGRYVIAVNGRSGPRLESPYAVTYFPGVSREDASVIELGEGERKTGLTIVVKRLNETTISGTVAFVGRSAIPEGFVNAAPVTPGGTFMSSSKIDSTGAFQLRVLAGLTYVISANTDGGSRRGETTVFVDQRIEGIRLSIRP